MFKSALWGIAAALVAPHVHDVSSTPFVYWACQYAAHRGFKITATTARGGHNRGSKHYRGLAIDVSVRGRSAAAIAAFKRGAGSWGWVVLDERRRLPGEVVWHGAHLHMQARGQTWQRQTHSLAGGLRRARRTAARRVLSRSNRARRSTRR